jgi:hypothetical protein
MLDEQELLGLLKGYIAGDVLARKVIVDLLEEAGDPRAEVMREERIDWEKLAQWLATGKKQSKRSRRPTYLNGEPARYRFQIECARYGSPTIPEVEAAVRDARRDWMKELFPEVEL